MIFGTQPSSGLRPAVRPLPAGPPGLDFRTPAGCGFPDPGRWLRNAPPTLNAYYESNDFLVPSRPAASGRRSGASRPDAFVLVLFVVALATCRLSSCRWSCSRHHHCCCWCCCRCRRRVPCRCCCRWSGRPRRRLLLLKLLLSLLLSLAALCSLR